MNRSWVRFPQAAQIRPPGSGWAFLYALTGRAAWCARGRRPAREIATREPAARSGRSRGPPWPCRRPPAPWPGPASLRRPRGGLLSVGAYRCQRSGPASAHRHRGLAPPPPTGAAARPRSRGLPMSLHDRQRARLKPPSPLLVRACVGLKPPSPLRARNERFWCSFRVQRWRWFQWLLFGGEHWCCGFQSPASE